MNKDISQVFQASIPFLSPLVFVNPALAQEIIPDGTVPTKVDRVGNVTEITGGTEKGNNLFHSFREFSVLTGNEAFFNIENNLNIENIFSRVTGGSLSNIDGLIRANGSANLFLLNPAGILFGANASLDIGGSFYGSTADSLLFDDGVEFSAVNPQNPILTINAPIGLSFRNNPAPITYRSSAFDPAFFAVKSNQTLALVGGDILIEVESEGDFSFLFADPDVKIELGGLSAAGIVEIDDGSLSFPDGVTRADVSLTDSAFIVINDVGEKGGITINAENLELSGQSLISANQFTASEPEDRAIISINASDKVSISNQAVITGQIFDEAVGKVRVIDINARSLEIISDLSLQESEQPASISAFANTQSLPQNEINIISINTSDKVFLDKGVIIGQVETGGSQRGNIDINTGSVELINNADVFLNNFITSGEVADTGKLNIKADRVLVDNSRLTTGLGATAEIDADTNIEILANSVEVINGGEISANSPGGGDAGSVIIDTKQLTIRENAEISVNSEGGGRAGELTITAKSVNLNQGILTASTEAETGGNINLIADDNITLRNNSRITAEATGNADGGSIDIQTEQLAVQSNSQITASTIGAGSGGEVKIEAESLNLNKGTIAAETTASIGGNINLDIEENIILRNHSQITAKATGNADGGNINIDANLIVANPNQNNDIIASAGQEGVGGRIEINTEGIFGLEERPQNDTTNDIDASGGIDGEVIINTPDVDISKKAIEAAQNFLALEQIVAQACSAEGIARKRSNLIVSGKGGIPSLLTAPMSSDVIYVEGESDNTQTKAVKKKFQINITNKERKEKRKIVTLVENSKNVAIDEIIPARGAIILENGDVILTAYPTPNSGHRSANSKANCTI